MTTQELIDAIRAHALANYTSGGWDFVVECWSDEEIADEIGECRSLDEAISRIGGIVGVLADYRSEIRSAAW